MGAFENYKNAVELRKKLSQFGSSVITQTKKNNKILYRVRLGPWKTPQEVKKKSQEVIIDGIMPQIIAPNAVS